MLKFKLVDKYGNFIINKIAFYTPTDLGYSVGDTVNINFTSQYSLSQSLLENQAISASNQHYLTFDISGIDLPQVGGQYIVDIVDYTFWENEGDDWDEAGVWGEQYEVKDTERGFIVSLILFDSYLSNFEEANYIKHNFTYTEYTHISDFEDASYLKHLFDYTSKTYTSSFESSSYISHSFTVTTSSYTSSFETSSYISHSFTVTTGSYTGSFESASYITASLNINSATPYISVREEGTYTIYNG